MDNTILFKPETDRLKLHIIVASTRPGRRGLPIGEWVRDYASEQGDFDVELVDLAEVGLPFMDEPNHPRFHKYIHRHTVDWSEKIDAADAFVFVAPEYNYGMNAVLKNALDYLHQEWQYKPVGFVSYGGVAAGTRAVQMTKLVVTALKMTPLNETVAIPFVNQFFDDEGRFQPTESMGTALRAMLDELMRVSSALKPLRAPVKLEQAVPAR
jgi:NAD(P)H-dependent FMN reductase